MKLIYLLEAEACTLLKLWVPLSAISFYSVALRTRWGYFGGFGFPLKVSIPSCSSINTYYLNIKAIA